MKKIHLIIVAGVCALVLAACGTAEPVTQEPAPAESQVNAPEVIEENVENSLNNADEKEKEPISQTGEIKTMGSRLLKSRTDPFAAGGNSLSLSINQAADVARPGLANLIPTIDEMLTPSGPGKGTHVNRLGSGAQSSPAFTTQLGDRISVVQGGFTIQPPSGGFDVLTGGNEFTADGLSDDYYRMLVRGSQLKASDDPEAIFDQLYEYLTESDDYPEFAGAVRLPHPDGIDGFMLEGSGDYRKQKIESIFVMGQHGDWMRIFMSVGEPDGWDSGYGDLTNAVRGSVLGLGEAPPAVVELDDRLTSPSGAFSVQPPQGYSNKISMSDGTIEMKTASGPSVSVTTEMLEPGQSSADYLDAVFENVFASNGLFDDPQRQPHPDGKEGFLVDEIMVLSKDVSLRVWAVVTVDGQRDVSFFAAANVNEWDAGFGDVVQAVYGSLEIESAEETAADGLQQITDDKGVISVSVPAGWSEIDGRSYADDDGNFDGYGLDAAPNLESLYSGWSVPGVTIYAIENDGYSTSDYLDNFDMGEMCDYAGREKLSDFGLRGHFDLWNNCGRNDALYFDMAAISADDAFISLQMTIVSEEDLDTLGVILESFKVELP